MKIVKNKLLLALENTGLLPVIPNTDFYSWQGIIDICYHCGIRVIEFRDALTGRGVELFTELVTYARQSPDFHIGVNTIHGKIAEKYIQGGASFITSSFLREDMAEVAHRNDVLWIPGCSSSVEVAAARQLGAPVVSLLPGACTPLALKSLQNEFHDISFIPSTGIVMKDQVMQQWLKAGVLCVRMGTQLFSSQDLSGKDWTKVERNILSVISAIKTVRVGNEILPVQAFNI